jgi:hypothetical protein
MDIERYLVVFEELPQIDGANCELLEIPHCRIEAHNPPDVNHEMRRMDRGSPREPL